jgi:Zn-dependent alcohol dehydrogenase
VLSFNSCGDCPACSLGRLPYCFNFSEHNMSGGGPDGAASFVDADGARVNSHFFGQSSFASRSVVAETSCVRVDPSYDLRKLGPLGCGGGSDYAFDTTGNAGVVRGLYEGLNNIGTLGMAGVGFGEITFDFLSMIGGRRITGVMEGDSTPREFIPRLAQLNADGKFPYDELIVEFPLADINAAEAASASGSVSKPVLIF